MSFSGKYKSSVVANYAERGFCVVGFMDVFTRRIYQEIKVESFIFCQSRSFGRERA
jgi:hypothetical protein